MRTKGVKNSKKKTFECPFSAHPMSCYQTTLKILTVMLPDKESCQGVQQIFWLAAGVKELADFIAHNKSLTLSAKCFYAIGPNSVNSHLKNIKTWASSTNSKRCTTHGKRGGGISTVCNAGVAPAIYVKLGGHTHLTITANYNKPNQAAFDQAILAKYGSPSKIWKALEIHKQVESDNDLLVDLQVNLDFSQSPSHEAAKIAASFPPSPEAPKIAASFPLDGTSLSDRRISNKFLISRLTVQPLLIARKLDDSSIWWA